MLAVSEPVRIWVDDREARGAPVASMLQAMEGVWVGVKRLSTGDYLIEGKALLERKRVPDFLESLKTGRLFAQASRLAGGPLRPFLVLEGPMQEWRQAGVTREGIQGALVTLAVGFGIPVLRSQDESETSRLILFTARQMQAGPKHPLRKPGRRLRGKRGLQVFILTGLPKVGPQRAIRLLDRFGTLEAVMSASEADLAEVEGIGRQTAQRIHWAVHEAITPYLS